MKAGNAAVMAFVILRTCFCHLGFLFMWECFK